MAKDKKKKEDNLENKSKEEKKYRITKETFDTDELIDEPNDDELGEDEEIEEEKQDPAGPLPATLSQLRNSVEVFEEKKYRITARNKPDARLALEFCIGAEDKIISLNSVAGGYDATVLHFVMREQGSGD